MINTDLIASPFLFNPLKHHLGFIRGFIKQAEMFANDPETFEIINCIGSQLTDIYCGLLSLNEIISHIKFQLIKQSAFQPSAFDAWIMNLGKDYNFIELPDGSKWTFRKGEQKGRHIHFHPARTNGSIRVKGTTLRTAIGLKIIARENLSLYQEEDFINSVRQNRLQLSPIKNMSHFPAIKKVLLLLNENNFIHTDFTNQIQFVVCKKSE